MIAPLSKDIEVLRNYECITLAQMDSVRLMNRTDTKFVFKRSSIEPLLKEMCEHYAVLNVEGNLISTYKTLYFDTPDFRFFDDHHNGKGSRYKVRIRNYVESNLFFLEIKHKYKERTIKNRIRLTDFEMDLQRKSKNYVAEVLEEKVNLEAKLWNGFERITLVNKKEEERLTLDLNLNFQWNNETNSFEHIVIAELKQGEARRESFFYQEMKKHGVRPNGMSKYCVGAVTLYPELKYNNFKEKFLLINKLTD